MGTYISGGVREISRRRWTSQVMTTTLGMIRTSHHAKLTHRSGQMTIKVWGGATTEPYEIVSAPSRNVTFDASKIIEGN